MISILHQIYITVGYTLLNFLPWSMIFLLLRPFGLRYYKLVKAEECKVIQKKIGENFSQTTDNNKGFGYSCGYWFVLYLQVNMSDYNENYELYLLATESSYLKLVDHVMQEEKDTEVFIEKPKIDIIERYGSYNNLWYKIRTIATPPIVERPEQKQLLDRIVSFHDTQKQSVIFLHGKPGIGKSMIGLLLANHYKGKYCDSFVPWEPNDTLVSIITESMPSKNKPLILVLEEIDIALERIHTGEIQPHKQFPILINDKASWNRFFDRIQRGLYPHVLILLTSNKSPQAICELDPAYLRENRVNLILELKD